MDCILPGSSVHGIFQARILEWIAISSSRGFSLPRNQTDVSCIAGDSLLLSQLESQLIGYNPIQNKVFNKSKKEKEKNMDKKEYQLQTSDYLVMLQGKWDLRTTTKGVSSVFECFIYLNINLRQEKKE